jgi:hypothetical protein
MALDSHTYGFAFQEATWQFDADAYPEVAAAFAREIAGGGFPNLLAMAEQVASDSGGPPLDFEFGLDLILDGLARTLASSGS